MRREKFFLVIMTLKFVREGTEANEMERFPDHLHKTGTLPDRFAASDFDWWRRVLSQNLHIPSRPLAEWNDPGQCRCKGNLM